MDTIKKIKFPLYHKYAIVIILAGIIPAVTIVATFLNVVVTKYQSATLYQYTQAANYVAADVTSLLDSYNTISKLPYYYNFAADENTIHNVYSFDSFRDVIYGESYDEENAESMQKAGMTSFLGYIASIDSDIIATHFISAVDEEIKVFHHSKYSAYIADEQKLLDYINYANWDTQTTDLIITPTHKSDYFGNSKYKVITIARNYYDLRGQVGHEKYLGTLLIDIKLTRIEKLFRQANFSGNANCYLLDEAGYCLYSDDKDVIGTTAISDIELLRDNKDVVSIVSDKDSYGLSAYIFMDFAEVYGDVNSIYRMILLLFALIIVLIILGSIYASKSITKPIYDIMSQMKQIETGNFDIELTVRGNDEIGVLSERFNQMSQALKKYINQSYLAKIKRDEAELTALKSQIYPHFLYNTLEIIRMTALEEADEKVARMIEALSEQIHYLIGPVNDMVPLDKEIDIVQKYVYLLNCRYDGKIQLLVECQKRMDVMIPKLILQPVVENAYVHGIKPKNGPGSILIETSEKDGVLEINVMDNGVGMSEDKIQSIYNLLESDAPGVKNEYDWQSIGIKNVNDRIKYLYGEEYGLLITSTPNIGTNIKISVPLNKN